jgi:hypothetical protein
LNKRSLALNPVDNTDGGLNLADNTYGGLNLVDNTYSGLNLVDNTDGGLNPADDTDSGLNPADDTNNSLSVGQDDKQDFCSDDEELCSTDDADSTDKDADNELCSTDAELSYDKEAINIEGTAALRVLISSITMLKATADAIDLKYNYADRLMLQKFVISLRNSSINELVNIYSTGFICELIALLEKKT